MASDSLLPDRLVGWKAIGTFLGVDARTAKRWEAARGLPVRRLPGDGAATVWADREELRAWLAFGPEPKPMPLPEPEPVAITRVAGGSANRWPIAGAIAATVLVGVIALIRLLPGAAAAAPALTSAYDDRSDARRLWLAGRFALATRSANGIAAAEQDFTALTRQFANRAPAYAALAETHVLSREFGAVPDGVAFPAADRAARTALALDPQLGEALLSKAFVDFWWTHDIVGGLAGFHRAVEREPACAKAHHWYATAASAVGDAGTARAEIAKAQALDPTNHTIVADAALIELSAGNVAGGRAALAEFVRVDPGLASAHRYLAMADLLAGRDADYLNEEEIALRLMGRGSDLPPLAAARAALGAGGRTAMLAREIADAEAAYASGMGTAGALARLYAIAGNRDQMLRWLAVARASNESEAAFLTADPALFAWRDDPAVRRATAHLG